MPVAVGPSRTVTSATDSADGTSRRSSDSAPSRGRGGVRPRLIGAVRTIRDSVEKSALTVCSPAWPAVLWRDHLGAQTWRQGGAGPVRLLLGGETHRPTLLVFGLSPGGANSCRPSGAVSILPQFQ